MKFCVSLTTLPSRINNIAETLKSINSQTLKPEKIFINLPYEFRRFKDYKFKDFDIKKLLDNNIEIVRCKDYGPSTKLMGSLENIRNNYNCVILLDDDHNYHPKLFEIFLKNYRIDQVNYSFYLNKIFNIRMGQCADGFLFNCKYLDEIEFFYNKYVDNNINMFLDDDLWFAVYLYLEKKTKIVSLIDEFRSTTDSKFVYTQNLNKDIDALHQTVHKDGLILNRRKIQKIEYIKYKIKKFFKY